MKQIKIAFAAASVVVALAMAAPEGASAAATHPGASAIGKTARSGSPQVIEAGRRRRRALGLGIAGAIVGGIIINEAVRADERRLARECRRLDRACAEGSGRACRIFDEECP